VQRIVEVNQKVWGAGDVALSLANATPYLEAVGHTVIAWNSTCSPAWTAPRRTCRTAGSETDP
jgi:hypothetical protein